MKNLWKYLLVVICVASMASCGTTNSPSANTATYQYIRPFDEVKTAPDFTLFDQNGKEFNMHDQKGKVVAMFFGFTSCPDVCPTALARISAAKKLMGESAKNLVIVFITVDPERDTQKRLGGYVQGFDPDIIALTGDAKTLEAVRKEYGVYAKKVELPNSALGYTMDHTAGVFIIDQQQRWLAMAEHDGDPKLLASDLSQLATTQDKDPK